MGPAPSERAFSDENHCSISPDEQQKQSEDVANGKCFNDSNETIPHLKKCANNNDGNGSQNQSSTTSQGQSSSSREATRNGTGSYAAPTSSCNGGGASDGDGGDERENRKEIRSGHYEEYEASESGDEVEAEASGENKRISSEIPNLRAFDVSGGAARAKADMQTIAPRDKSKVHQYAVANTLHQRSSDQREESPHEIAAMGASSLSVEDRASSSRFLLTNVVPPNENVKTEDSDENNGEVYVTTADEERRSETTAVATEPVTSGVDQNPNANSRGYTSSISVPVSYIAHERTNSLFRANDREYRGTENEGSTGSVISRVLGCHSQTNHSISLIIQHAVSPAAEVQTTSVRQIDDKRDTTPSDFTDGNHRPLPSSSHDSSEGRTPHSVQVQDNTASSAFIYPAPTPPNPWTPNYPEGYRRSRSLVQPVSNRVENLQNDNDEEELGANQPRDRCAQCREYITDDHICLFIDYEMQRATGASFGGPRTFLHDPDGYFEY